MAFSDDLKATRNYIVTAVKGVWGTTSHEPPEIENAAPFTLVTTESITMEPETVSSSDEALVAYSVAGRFAKVSNLDDAKIDKFHAARDAILADPHAGGSATEVRVTSAAFGDAEVMDGYYEVAFIVEARISAARP